MRVLVFGDSITQGYWAVEHGWVDRLRLSFDKTQANNLKKNNEPTVFNLGISADTSSDILHRIEGEIKTRTRPHHKQKPVVVLQVGVNDSCREPEEHRVPMNEYKKNLVTIIERIKPIVSGVVLVGFSACDESQTMPVFWGEHNYSNADIREYEKNMGDVAKESNIEFIPVFDSFKKELTKDSSILPDGLHPNDRGHEIIYNIVRPRLEELLK